MKVVVISDTHGDHRNLSLPEGDLLIHAGDISMDGTPTEIADFTEWFDKTDFQHKILIAGNHDRSLESDSEKYREVFRNLSFTYLEGEAIEINGLRFWGSAITPRFFDWSFMLDEGEPLQRHWTTIPDSLDVLITHGPPYGIMDLVGRENGEHVHAGCRELLPRVQAVSPRYHIFGHIHEGYGQSDIDGVRYINASSMNEHYILENPAIVFDLD